MIIIIANKLERCHDRHGNLLDFEFVANELLEDIEEAGMAPPLYIPEDAGVMWGDEPTGEPNGFNMSIADWEDE